MTDRNLTPYFLTFGPILLVGAFMLWPASEAIGVRGTQSLVDAQDTLMPLLVVGTLGTIMVLSGVYLLISEMMENTGGMNKQLLTVAGVLIVVTLMAFITGMGSNVTVINEADREIDADDEAFAYESEADRSDTLNNAFDAGNTVWQMSPVTWGLSLVLIGLVSFMMKRPETAMEYVLPALMPLGTVFLALPILNTPALFNVVFPVTLLFHIIIGGLMLTGKLAVPGSTEEGA
tara:strand:- start:810 stop:1508 length:699 start_codon:yes stop_codon:yes gene_type:complete